VRSHIAGGRGRVIIEVGALAIAAPLFLVVVPRRPIFLDLVLAPFALSLVAVTARDTREPFGARRLGRSPNARATRRVIC
jgi:hypothetical protein